MKTFIFIGPTITRAEAMNWLNAEYLPPIAQGDIASLLHLKPDIIGIVDGYFDQVPSVWHKEILLALSQGIQVVGASSMGALRAAELHRFGMQGIGQVYEWYRDGVIEADDEVAIRHASAEFDYRPISEAMVNIRSTFNTACIEGVITQATRDALINICRDIHYSERSFSSVFTQATQSGLPQNEILELQKYTVAHAIDQKKLDAIALLQYIAGQETVITATTADLDVQNTVFVAGLLDNDVRADFPDARARTTVQDIADYARLACMDIQDVLQKAGMRRMLVNFARQLEIQANEKELANELKEFQAECHLETETELHIWQRNNSITNEEFMEHIKELALEKKMIRLFVAPTNQDILWQLRLKGRYESIISSLKERERIRLAADIPLVSSSEELLDAYRRQTGNSWINSPENAIQKLGFRNKSSLLIELQKSYQYYSQMESVKAVEIDSIP